MVNQEIEELDCLLDSVILKLSPGGRGGVLSFHSLEDRRVKMRFKELSHEKKAQEKWSLITKKPLCPEDQEIEINPRSRSAKLRVIQRDIER
jgi:16S rRNA (cytosine1402-N4)-methyltransferase